MDPTVLIVEDEAAIVTMLRYNLEREGMQVVEAGDGDEALKILAETHVDLVLLDWMLPVSPTGSRRHAHSSSQPASGRRCSSTRSRNSLKQAWLVAQSWLNYTQARTPMPVTPQFRLAS